MKPRWARLPLALVYLRGLLILPIVLILFWQLNEVWLLICLFIGLISDIFDGIIARRIGVVTTSLRRADTIVDTFFFSSIVVAAWITHSEPFQKYFVGLAVLIVLKLVRIMFDFAKYGREAAYHMWSTKLWGITVVLALASLWLGVSTDVIFAVAILLGIVTNIEGLLASIILPTWQHDVPTLLHAYKLRNDVIT